MPQYARPFEDVTVGGWTSTSGGDLFDDIDESTVNDADYIQSPPTPTTPQATETKLAALSDPFASTGHIIRYRVGKDTTGGDTIDVTVYLMQGATVIATWNHTNVIALTTYTQTLTAGEADAITNYSDLRLRFSVITVAVSSAYGSAIYGSSVYGTFLPAGSYGEGIYGDGAYGG